MEGEESQTFFKSFPFAFSQGQGDIEAAKLCLESMGEEGWNLPREYVLYQVEVGA